MHSLRVWISILTSELHDLHVFRICASLFISIGLIMLSREPQETSIVTHIIERFPTYHYMHLRTITPWQPKNQTIHDCHIGHGHAICPCYSSSHDLNHNIPLHTAVVLWSHLGFLFCPTYVQLGWTFNTSRRKNNLPTNQKRYNTFEITVGKLSARRIQVCPDYFCLGIILKVMLNNFQNNA